jgi:glycosyltransferase involved in cell wall biosynthesis
LLIEGLSAFSPTFAPRFCRIPALADIRLDPFAAAQKHPFLAPFATARLRQDMNRYRVLVANSPSLRSALKTKCPGAGPVRVVCPGIENKWFETSPIEEKFILFLGRIDVDHKGLDYLVQCYGRIRRQFPDIRLVVAGAGPDEARFRRLLARKGLQEAVEMRGWVEGQEKIDLLRKCLLVCMPSRREGWPAVANEAAACAKPVVGHDVTGLRDSVADGKTGFLVELGDVDAFTDAVRRLLEDDSMRRDLGRRARERARQFTWEKAASSYQLICEEVASRR